MLKTNMSPSSRNITNEPRSNCVKFRSLCNDNYTVYESIRQSITDPQYWEIEEAYFFRINTIMEGHSSGQTSTVHPPEEKAQDFTSPAQQGLRRSTRIADWVDMDSNKQ